MGGCLELKLKHGPWERTIDVCKEDGYALPGEVDDSGGASPMEVNEAVRGDGSMNKDQKVGLCGGRMRVGRESQVGETWYLRGRLGLGIRDTQNGDSVG